MTLPITRRQRHSSKVHTAPAAQVHRTFSPVWLLPAACMFLSLAGCNHGPARVNQPGINASAAGSGAVELYDADGDGLIGDQELENAPALLAALPRLDTDDDGGVSANEVTARVEAWKEMRTGLASVRCNVTLDGQPLVGAIVAFEPEPFLGDEIKTAHGTTNHLGDVAPTVPPEDRPDPTLPGGVHFGLYKVRISREVNGRETIPSRYNRETILGQEVSYDDPALNANSMAFALKSSE